MSNVEKAVEELTLMLLYLTRQKAQRDDVEYFGWRNYPNEIIKKMEEEYLLYTTRSRAYLSLDAMKKAQLLLTKYQIDDIGVYKDFVFEMIDVSNEEEIKQAIDVEQTCFPPHEACSIKHMRERINQAGSLFMVAKEKATNKVVGILNGIATDERKFKDEFFTNATLHQEDGKTIMLTGLAVLPDYQRKGIAKAMMNQYVLIQAYQDRSFLVLTCLENKLKMYRKLGFSDCGIADSTWGNEVWHEMIRVL